nr:unnamed protein product [Callosobruchus chinensis]
MDQETARKLYEEGAIFVFLNVPEGTEFGIDMKSWNTGEKFRGVKMIPPGLHYIFYSAVSNTGDTAPRTGFFHNFRKGEVLVKKWDEVNECVSAEIVNDEEIVKLKENLRALDSFLGPYPYDIQERWKSLTSDLTDDLVKSLVPLSGYIQSALELESCSDADRPKGKKPDKDEDPAEHSLPSDAKRLRTSSNMEDTLLPHLKAKVGTELRLTNFPAKNYPDGSTPADITKHSLDSSYVFDLVVSSYEKPSNIIGELQFCYICFLVGHSLEAFDQWKKIFSLFCSCETAIKKHRRLFNRFLSVIEAQVQEVPEEFLADIVTNNNFVYVKLRQLFRTIPGLHIDGEIKTKAERLKESLTDLYEWDFGHLESEDEDEAPVIVEVP